MNFANFLVATLIFVLQAVVQVQAQISLSGGYAGSINTARFLAAPKTPTASIFIQAPRKTSIFFRPPSSNPPAPVPTPISLPTWIIDGLVDESSAIFVPTRNTGSCSDVPPDNEYTCEQQAFWGKCNEPWMTQGSFCVTTCGRCTSGGGCEDVPPDAEYSCEQQAQWGKCNEAWMIQGGFCAKACGRCNSGVQYDDCNTVYEVLQGIPELSVFVQAVQSAGFVDLFNNIDLEATVFAPTNAAFQSLAQSLGAIVEVVLDDINLPKVLMHNTIPGATLKKKDFANGQILGTGEQGQSITIIINNNNGEVFQVQSNGPIANVISRDIEACDAVVHIVDQVLLPNFDLIEN